MIKLRPRKINCLSSNCRKVAKARLILNLDQCSLIGTVFHFPCKGSYTDKYLKLESLTNQNDNTTEHFLIGLLIIMFSLDLQDKFLFSMEYV